MIPPMIGNLIVIAALVAVAALAVRSIWTVSYTHLTLPTTERV